MDHNEQAMVKKSMQVMQQSLGSLMIEQRALKKTMSDLAQDEEEFEKVYAGNIFRYRVWVVMVRKKMTTDNPDLALDNLLQVLKEEAETNGWIDIFNEVVASDS